MSAEGSGYTWSVNSRENQLTPWSNDPARIGPGRHLFAMTAPVMWGPLRASTATWYWGTVYAHHGRATVALNTMRMTLVLSCWCMCRVHDSIKICRLKLRNDSRRTRSLSITTAYVEWVLGTTRRHQRRSSSLQSR